ncbi:MAG: hypothetical protein ABTQ34_06295 [Bdellovibrionales bacterium]
MASLALFFLALVCLRFEGALAAPARQESREASFVPPTTEEAPLSLIYQSLSTPATEPEQDSKVAPALASSPDKTATTTGASQAQSAPASSPQTAASTPASPSSQAAESASLKPTSPEVSLPSVSAPPLAIPGAKDAAKNADAKIEALRIEKSINQSVDPKGSVKDDKGVVLEAAPDAAPAPTSASSPSVATTAAAVPAQASSATVPSNSPIAPISPDAFGLLVSNEGGFGVGLWKGTARATVERLMPALTLPMASPILNKLAYRLLASSAAPPEGVSQNILPGSSLTSLRIQKLVALGRPVEAWKMVVLAKDGVVDDEAKRMAAEATLASGDQSSIAEVCAHAPDILKNRPSHDWQKILVVCHLRANDMKSAQLGLDVMTTQKVKDEIFFMLATKNALGGSKQLPRQLTPLKPLSLALIRLANLPLRNELYARPPAAIIPEILNGKTESLDARVSLAERAAAQGLIDAEFLGKIYAGVDFSHLPLVAKETDANKVRATGSMLRARLYQIAMKDKSQDNRLNAALRLIQSVPPPDQGGAMRNLALMMLSDLTPDKASALMTASPAAALMISLLADDKPDRTLGWIKVAQDEAARTPSAKKALKNLWPLIALNGFESEKDFSKNIQDWLKHILKLDEAARLAAANSVSVALIQEDAAFRARREVAGVILLILDAAGIAIPDDVWAQVVDAPRAFDKIHLPSALLLERLRESGRAKRKGETVLEALVAAGSADNIPLAVRIDITRALRHAGFAAEAVAFARETLLATGVLSAGGSNGSDAP